MATVEQILKDAGIGDEQVRGLDPKMITAFGGVLSEAQAARDQAELAKRSYTDMYQNQIAPALIQWDEDRARTENEMANLRAENSFYKTQNEQARASGFVASDAPGFQARNAQGQYVAGVPGGTPGSPQYQGFDVNKVYERAGDAVGILTDIQWEYQRLYDGKPMPISPTELVRRADSVKLDPRTYATREFNFEGRRAEMQRKAQEDHDSQIRREAESARDRAWSEKLGSNPDIRIGQPSKYSDNQRAVRAGTMPDPLMLSESERRQATRKGIRDDMAEAER